MTAYLYREESGYDEKFAAENDQAAEDRAREMLREGDWNQGCEDKSFRVRARVWRVETEPDGEELQYEGRTVMVQFDPPEPPCPGREEHDWRDRGVPGAHLGSFGSGGGVLVREACAECGACRETDTWATDPANGEPFTSVSYQPAGHYDVTAGEDEDE